MSAPRQPAASADAQLLADGFAQHLKHWALARGCDEETAALVSRCGQAASLATAGGHVCIMLDDVAPALGHLAALRERLLASGVVGTPAAPNTMPLILDDDGRVYLHRQFDEELRLARRLSEAAAVPDDDVDSDTTARLNELFRENAALLGGAHDWQKAAAALALRRRLVVISGGPGTGKTTTVVNLLACLLARDPESRIALAAPTGKAAARMVEAIGRRARNLPDALRERLPSEASTVHRLLGVLPGSDTFRFHASNRLPIDTLVVDEASMLDLSLATHLLEAVPAGARIVLLGDKDQLAAVEAGAVFAELCADPALPVPPAQRPARGALPDTTVSFTHNFRFAADSGIGRLASDIRTGRSAAACAWLGAHADPSVRWIDDAGARPSTDALAAITDGFAHYLSVMQRQPLDRAAAIEAFDAFRVLCPLRDGPRGVVAINEHMTRHARTQLASLLEQHGPDPRSPWFAGRPVMVLRNDYLLKLFNGDIGIALPGDDGELAVFFPDGKRGLRAVAPVRMPAHETAFATTVHKSQGSEFQAVLVMMPHAPGPVATRELLYTAVTRAARQVTLCAGQVVIAAAIDTPTARRSGLGARLAHARRALGGT